MRQGSGFEEHAAVEVGEEVAGAGLGTVQGDDAEVLGSNGLDAGRQQARGFLQDEALAGLGRGRGSRTWHRSFLSSREGESSTQKAGTGPREEIFFSANPHTTVICGRRRKNRPRIGADERGSSPIRGHPRQSAARYYYAPINPATPGLPHRLPW